MKELISKSIIESMRNKDDFKKSLLICLKSDAEAIAKNESSRLSTDDDYVNACKSLIKKLSKTLSEIKTKGASQDNIDKYQLEIDFYSSFLPKEDKLSDDVIKSMIDNFIAGNDLVIDKSNAVKVRDFVKTVPGMNLAIANSYISSKLK